MRVLSGRVMKNCTSLMENSRDLTRSERGGMISIQSNLPSLRSAIKMQNIVSLSIELPPSDENAKPELYYAALFFPYQSYDFYLLIFLSYFLFLLAACTEESSKEWQPFNNHFLY
jgi:hypothetical protein